MRVLNLAIVQPFYKTQYWNPVQGDKLPRGVDYLCFDLAVNGGPARAAMTLQQALGVTADGVIGPQTTNAAAFADARALAQKFTDIKIAFYKSLNSPVYERGWVNRAHEALAIANRMIASA
jgi:lysozyme family protein